MTTGRQAKEYDVSFDCCEQSLWGTAPDDNVDFRALHCLITNRTTNK